MPSARLMLSVRVDHRREALDIYPPCALPQLASARVRRFTTPFREVAQLVDVDLRLSELGRPPSRAAIRHELGDVQRL